jgi:hypothetical protein
MKQREFSRFSVRCRLRNAAAFDPDAMPLVYKERGEVNETKESC